MAKFVGCSAEGNSGAGFRTNNPNITFEDCSAKGNRGPGFKDDSGAVFMAAAKAIQEGIGDRDAKLDALSLLGRMDEAKQTPAYARLYERFVGLAADHVALAPYVGAMGAFLR